MIDKKPRWEVPSRLLFRIPAPILSLVAKISEKGEFTMWRIGLLRVELRSVISRTSY